MPRVVVLLAAVVVPLVVLVAIALVARSTTSARWDTSILEWMRRHHHRPLTMDVRTLTNAGSFAIVGPVALLIVLLLAWRRRGRAAAFVAVTVLADLALNTVLKVAFHRHPPHVFVSLARESTYSFPSGHTMNATSLAVCIVVVLWHTRWRWAAVGGALVYSVAIGLSRLYLGVHYPTDALAGWAFALVLALGLAFVFDVGRGEAAARAGAGARAGARAAGGAGRGVAGGAGARAAGGAGRRSVTRAVARVAAGGRSVARTAGGRAATNAAARPAPVILLDWGNTLMIDGGEFSGPMAEWPSVRAVAGAKSALRRLRPGHRLVVATNADDSDGAAVRAALARAGLAELVDDIVSSRDVGVRKPEAGFFAAALQQAGGGEDHLEPADIVMVGDSWENDVAGAKAAGLRAVWLNPDGLPRPPARTAAEDTAAGDAEPIGADRLPDAVITSMRALPAAIRRLERGY